jgi:hypothetical protein
MKYLIQKSEQKPEQTDVLPPDITDLEKGEWKHSKILQAYVGFHLSPLENYTLYHDKVNPGVPLDPATIAHLTMISSLQWK